MLTKTNFFVSTELIDQALDTLEGDEFRQVINKPTGDFFYDPWVIADELRGTVWEKIYDTLPKVKGEARIIRLKPTQSYFSHADIDDRWHLNLTSKKSYLINLDKEKMFKLVKDGYWYDLDAGDRHTAVNFGNRPRVQLVIRKLLNRSTRNDLVTVKIITTLDDLEDARFEFDDNISPVLNEINKKNGLDNFSYTNANVSFDVAPDFLKMLEYAAGKSFKILS
jgi:hypothetical protein